MGGGIAKTGLAQTLELLMLSYYEVVRQRQELKEGMSVLRCRCSGLLSQAGRELVTLGLLRSCRRVPNSVVWLAVRQDVRPLRLRSLFSP